MTAGLPPPFSLVAVDRIDSTNDEARRLVAQGAGHGTVIWAKEQTAGRGRRGRAWVSPPVNIHCSIVLHPGPSLAHAPQLTFVAAVALRDALAEFLPSAPFQCKWPNDLLVAGRKVAGMLLEVAGPWIILGVGVNVAHTPNHCSIRRPACFTLAVAPIPSMSWRAFAIPWGVGMIAGMSMALRRFVRHG